MLVGPIYTVKKLYNGTCKVGFQYEKEERGLTIGYHIHRHWHWSLVMIVTFLRFLHSILRLLYIAYSVFCSSNKPKTQRPKLLDCLHQYFSMSIFLLSTPSQSAARGKALKKIMYTLKKINKKIPYVFFSLDLVLFLKYLLTCDHFVTKNMH